MHFKVLSENFISTLFLFQLSSKKRTQSYANEGYCWEDETIAYDICFFSVALLYDRMTTI